MLPGPPPVTRCSVCASVLDQFNIICALMGQTVVSIRCKSGCTSVLPIDNPSNRSQAGIFIAHSKDDVRNLMSNRPTSDTCLLVTSRNVTGIRHTILRSISPVHSFSSDSPMGTSVNEGCDKPSPVLMFCIPGDPRPLARCDAAAEAELPDKKLKQIYLAKIPDYNKPLRCLFDSGACTSFISSHLAQKLRKTLSPSSYKAVATATGRATPISGAFTMKLQWDAAVTPVTVNVLPSLISSVDIIIGEDFMLRHKVSLSYTSPPCCTLESQNGPVILSQSSLSNVQSACAATCPDKTEEVEKSTLENQISASMALKLLKRKNLKRPYVALIMPEDIPEAPDPSETNPSNPRPSGSAVLTNVPDEYKTMLQSLIDEFPEIFSESPQAGGANIDPLRNIIDLVPGSKPPFRRNYRLSPLEFQELRRQVTTLLEKGIITPSNSPYGAPVLFIPKPDGSLRFCLDYRALNEQTIKIRYPLPRIDDLLDAAKGSKYYSTLDLAAGYYQLPLVEHEAIRTGFTAGSLGQFHWKTLPMGIANAPGAFMRTMNTILEEYIAAGICTCYLDDIMVMGKTAQAHIDNLRKVFQKLRDHRLTVKLSKCKFMQTQVKFLGHILSEDGIRADPRKIQSLLDWEFPENATGMLQFLGLANYFRKFIPDFSRLSAVLYHLIKKTVQFQKGEEAQLAFDAIKQLLMNPPLLAYPDPDKPYEVISDASLTGCGAVLVQEGRPIAYFSSRFSSAERNYTTGEQELLGIIKALKEWRCYLEGCNGLTLVTDHNPLTFFSKQPTLSRRQARWSEFLSRFNFDVRYRPGATNPADSLSRLPAPVASLLLLAVTVNEFNTDLLVKIKAESATDPHLSDPSNTRQYEQQSGYERD